MGEMLKKLDGGWIIAICPFIDSANNWHCSDRCVRLLHLRDDCNAGKQKGRGGNSFELGLLKRQDEEDKGL